MTGSNIVPKIEGESSLPVQVITRDEMQKGGIQTAADLLNTLSANMSFNAYAETTALGAAYLAGVGIGMWTISDVRDGWRERARYEPRMGEDERATLLAGWGDALARTRGVALPAR